jgi:hypothetical protein
MSGFLLSAASNSHISDAGGSLYRPAGLTFWGHACGVGGSGHMIGSIPSCWVCGPRVAGHTPDLLAGVLCSASVLCLSCTQGAMKHY